MSLDPPPQRVRPHELGERDVLPWHNHGTTQSAGQASEGVVGQIADRLRDQVEGDALAGAVIGVAPSPIVGEDPETVLVEGAPV